MHRNSVTNLRHLPTPVSDIATFTRIVRYGPTLIAIPSVDSIFLHCLYIFIVLKKMLVRMLTTTFS